MSASVAIKVRDAKLYHDVAPAMAGEGDYGSNTAVLLYVYPSGDCDTFDWPLTTTYRTEAEQLDQIADAMRDSREQGLIAADVDTAVLPDGREVAL